MCKSGLVVMLCVFVLELFLEYSRLQIALSGGPGGVLPFISHRAMSRPILKGMVFAPFCSGKREWLSMELRDR